MSENFTVRLCLNAGKRWGVLKWAGDLPEQASPCDGLGRIGVAAWGRGQAEQRRSPVVQQAIHKRQSIGEGRAVGPIGAGVAISDPQGDLPCAG